MQAQITVADKILEVLPVNDLNLYLEKGDMASRIGEMNESYEWYMKGLRKARKLQNQSMISKFSGLIFTLL